MSYFAVTLETLATVEKHPDADRLDIGTLVGMNFQFVMARGQFKVGDHVFYIPEDAVLPERILEKLGLVGKLAGVEKNRVKAIKLRGFISQGIVAHPSTLGLLEYTSGMDFAPLFGITKYDPPVIETPQSFLRPLALIHRSRYDIESGDRFTAVIDALMDTEVVITEKLEGENTIVHCDDNGLFVASRASVIEEKEGCADPRILLVKQRGLDVVAQELFAKHGKPISIYAERIGPGTSVGNYYETTPELFVFDIQVGYDFLGNEAYLEAVLPYNFRLAPLIRKAVLGEWLNGQTLREASNGLSLVFPAKRREGIVIKPVVERPHPQLGRLILKQRSPEYLAQ